MPTRVTEFEPGAVTAAPAATVIPTVVAPLALAGDGDVAARRGDLRPAAGTQTPKSACAVGPSIVLPVPLTVTVPAARRDHSTGIDLDADVVDVAPAAGCAARDGDVSAARGHRAAAHVDAQIGPAGAARAGALDGDRAGAARGDHGPALESRCQSRPNWPTSPPPWPVMETLPPDEVTSDPVPVTKTP